jgi:hypothetical protein
MLKRSAICLFSLFFLVSRVPIFYLYVFPFCPLCQSHVAGAVPPVNDTFFEPTLTCNLSTLNSTERPRKSEGISGKNQDVIVIDDHVRAVQEVIFYFSCYTPPCGLFLCLLLSPFF